jgi:hypothetical protein
MVVDSRKGIIYVFSMLFGIRFATSKGRTATRKTARAQTVLGHVGRSNVQEDGRLCAG